MHELSLVLSIVDLIEEKALENHAAAVESVNLEIGELAGIDWSALDFAWQSATPGTILENARCVIEKVQGEAECLECGTKFHAENYFDPCPKCNQFLTTINNGRQFRVKSFSIA
jgi:hydrogenase nickel incorporation protein HypA/HybF